MLVVVHQAWVHQVGQPGVVVGVVAAPASATGLFLNAHKLCPLVVVVMVELVLGHWAMPGVVVVLVRAMMARWQLAVHDMGVAVVVVVLVMVHVVVVVAVWGHVIWVMVTAVGVQQGDVVLAVLRGCLSPGVMGEVMVVLVSALWYVALT